MHEEGKTIIIVTHDMNVVLNYATDVIALKEGKVAYIGEPHGLFNMSSDDLALDIPPLYAFSKYLYDKGMNIDINKIRSIDDLFDQLKGDKHE